MPSIYEENDSFVFSDARYKYRIESQNVFVPVVCTKSLLSTVEEKINELGLKRILMDPNDISYADFLENFSSFVDKSSVSQYLSKI